MQLLTWKQKDTWGHVYDIHGAAEQPSALKFDKWNSQNAVYTSGNDELTFASQGMFKQAYDVLRDGEKIAEARTAMFGDTLLVLSRGDNYKIVSESFSNNWKVLNAAGETVLQFTQPAFSFTSKGEAHVSGELPEVDKELLISTVLYLKVNANNVLVLLIIFFMFFMVIR